MSASTATAVRIRRAAPTAAQGARTSWVTSVLAAVAAVLVALSGWATYELLAGPSSSAGSATTLEVPGGEVHVLSVKPEVMAHTKGMPASMMPDPVPAGFRRVSVEVTLVATAEEGMRYDAGSFRVVGTGMSPVASKRTVMGSGAIPEAAQLRSQLVFQIPQDATGVALTGGGGTDTLPLTLPAAAPHGHPSAP